MRLPPFLRFLEPKFRQPVGHDGLSFCGHLKVERKVRGCIPEVICDQKNFIVDGGITGVRDILVGANGGGFAGSIFRMAVGDGGTPPGELFNPKLSDSSWGARTGLFHEVIRQDIDVFSTPTSSSMRFVGSFNSVDVDVTSFSISDRVINEAALIIGDGALTTGGDKKQINKSSPDSVDADELMFSTRTFKSASFDPNEDVNLSVTWTISITKK